VEICPKSLTIINYTQTFDKHLLYIFYLLPENYCIKNLNCDHTLFLIEKHIY